MGVVREYLARLREEFGWGGDEEPMPTPSAAHVAVAIGDPKAFATNACVFIASAGDAPVGLIVLAADGLDSADRAPLIACSAAVNALRLGYCLIGRLRRDAIAVLAAGLAPYELDTLGSTLQATLMQTLNSHAGGQPQAFALRLKVVHCEAGATFDSLLNAAGFEQAGTRGAAGRAEANEPGAEALARVPAGQSGKTGSAPATSAYESDRARGGPLPGQLPGLLMLGAKLGGITQVQPWSRANQTLLLPNDHASRDIPASWSAMLEEFGRGMNRGDVVLHYQPKFQASTYEVVGVEALMRWRHPKQGFIAPDKFIPVIEAVGDCRAMTEWVLEKILAAQAELFAAGYPIEMSVNVPAMLISDRAFATAALNIAARRCAPIGFEITETGVFGDPEGALENLHRFAEAGIRIAIDDYGVGMSSLTYLKRLPAHELKIDKSFVSGMTHSHRDPIIVRSTIDLAHGLAMTATAEGIESPTELALLRVMGCDHIQGYLMAKPMPLDQLRVFLADKGRLAHLPRDITALARADLDWVPQVQAAAG